MSAGWSRAGLAMVVLGLLLPSSHAADDPSIDPGFHYLYNLQFDDALTQFYGWQKQFPVDPVRPAAESAAYLFQEFNRLGILELQLFMRSDSLGARKKVEPDPKIRVRFFDLVKRTTEKAS